LSFYSELSTSTTPSLVDPNLTSIYSNSCGILRLFLLSKCTGLSTFFSTRLRSATFGITGPLVTAGRRIPYAGRVSGTNGPYSTLSYSRVRARALAGVMCVSDNPLFCEVLLHTRFNTLQTIYQNSRSPPALCINNIFGLWNQISFPSIG